LAQVVCLAQTTSALAAIHDLISGKCFLWGPMNTRVNPAYDITTCYCQQQQQSPRHAAKRSVVSER
jgi:hypothetical protein